MKKENSKILLVADIAHSYIVASFEKTNVF